MGLSRRVLPSVDHNGLTFCKFTIWIDKTTPVNHHELTLKITQQDMALNTSHVLCITPSCKMTTPMVFNATFNNISVISRRSVLLVEETGIPGEKHQPVARH
jgi:hypothetical protein